MTRVLIADDHAIVRAGLRALIHAETGMELVGEAAGGYEAIELVEKNQPDVLVLDLSMPDLDGISVTRILKQKYSELRILILTLHEDKALLKEAIKAGAKAVWMQEGIINEEAARRAREAGLLVVMDKCMRKEHMRLMGKAEEVDSAR